MSEALKHCNECGGEAQIVEPVEGIFMVCCTECGLHYRAFDDKDIAVSEWNERTINAQLKPCPSAGVTQPFCMVANLVIIIGAFHAVDVLRKPVKLIPLMTR